MEKIKSVRIKLTIDERLLLNRARNLLNDLLEACKNESDLDGLKELTEKAWLALDFILEETDA